jgi:transcriptional regulator with XRE-family HTH domain
MSQEGTRSGWRQDPEFLAAQKELRPFLDVAADMLRLRMRSELTQAELANLVGTKQANISRLESGLSNPTLQFLQKVAQALGAQLSVRFEEEITEEAYSTSFSETNTGCSQEYLIVPNWPQRPSVAPSWNDRALAASWTQE